MANVQITTEISVNDLLKTIDQLKGKEFDNFVQQVLKLRAKRLVPTINNEEATLLQAINQPIPVELKNSFNFLDKKRQAETLSKEEHQQLIQTTIAIEELHNNRMEKIIELAHLRKQPFKEVIKEFNLQNA